MIEAAAAAAVRVNQPAALSYFVPSRVAVAVGFVLNHLSVGSFLFVLTWAVACGGKWGGVEDSAISNFACGHFGHDGLIFCAEACLIKTRSVAFFVCVFIPIAKSVCFPGVNTGRRPRARGNDWASLGGARILSRILSWIRETFYDFPRLIRRKANCRWSWPHIYCNVASQTQFDVQRDVSAPRVCALYRRCPEKNLVIEATKTKRTHRRIRITKRKWTVASVDMLATRAYL